MPAPKDFFAYSIVEKDAGGMITGRLLHVRPTLEAVCRYLRQCNLQPPYVHVCGWDKSGGQWVVPTEEIDRAMRGEG